MEKSFGIVAQNKTIAPECLSLKEIGDASVIRKDMISYF
jgi:hypothetical protein